MTLRINTNIEAFNAHRQLEGTQQALTQSMEKLSSGLRINRAADDAAGLAISEKMRAQINGLEPGPPERPRRHLDGADRGRRAERGPLDPAARPRARRPVQQRHALRRRPRRHHGRDQPALRRGRPHRRRRPSSTASTCCRGTDAVTFQVGANAGETIALAGANLGGTYFDSGVQRLQRRPAPTSPASTTRSRRSPTSAPPSAPPRTGSSTPSRTSASTRRTCPPPSRASATSTWRPRW